MRRKLREMWRERAKVATSTNTEVQILAILSLPASLGKGTAQPPKTANFGEAKTEEVEILLDRHLPEEEKMQDWLTLPECDTRTWLVALWTWIIYILHD